MADSGHSTATLRLTVGELRIVHPITVPSGPVPATEVVPALQGLVNAVVEAAERRSEGAGQTISCRKGCGACCRQLVPVSRTEGERLLQLVEAMPGERQETLRARFAAAEAAIDGAGLKERGGRSDRELSAGLLRASPSLPVPRGGELLDPSRAAAGLPRVSRHLAGRALRRAGAGRRDAGRGAQGLDGRARPAGRERRLVSAGAADGLESHARRARLSEEPGPEWVQRFLRGLAAASGKKD